MAGLLPPSSCTFLHHSFLTNSCHINPPPKIVVATAAPTPWSWHNKFHVFGSNRSVVEKSSKRGEPPFFSPKISKSRTKLNTISRLIRYSLLDCPSPHSPRKNIFIRPPVTSRLDAYSAFLQAELQSSNQGRSSDPVSNTCKKVKTTLLLVSSTTGCGTAVPGVGDFVHW